MIFKKVIYIFLAAVLWASTVGADEAKRVVSKNTSREQHFLWKVTSPQATVYLFGSIHFGKPEMYPLPGVIEKAFTLSDSLVLEVNLERLDPVMAQQTMLQRGSYGDGTSLKDRISLETLGRLEVRLAQFGLDLEQVRHFKPWLMAMTLSVIQLQMLGFDSNYGIDHYFAKKAIAEKKTILEFEGLQEQLDFLDSIKDQEKFLDYTLVSLDETEKTLEKIIAAWESGDADVMEKVVIQELLVKYPEVAPMLDLLLYERNYRMVDRIKKFLGSGKTYFVVVGSAHLIGEKGIVELLRQDGLQVTQL